MKKLLTLIVTLCIFFIGFTSVKAIETITTQAQNGRIEYYDSNNVLQYNTVSCSANRCTFQNTNYNQLNAFWFYFSSNQSTFSSHLVFTGSVTFETELDLTQDSFVNYLPESISSIGLMAGNGVTRIGSCTLNNLIQTNSNNLLGQTTNPVHNVYGKTYNFTVDCLTESILNSGQNQNILQFYINSPRFPQNDVLVTSIELNTYTIGYNGEYTDDIQSLINAINNISINGATVNVDQTPVTNAIDDSTQDIIDNQNTNSQAEINSQKVCYTYDLNSSEILHNYLNVEGELVSNNTFNVTKYISINSNSEITILNKTGAVSSLCFYNVNKNLISCQNYALLVNNQLITIPNNSSFVRFSINSTNNRPQFRVCNNGNQALSDSINQTNDYLTQDPEQDIDNIQNDLYDTLSGIGQESDEFHLLDIVKLPILLIQEIVNHNTCQPIVLPLPYVNSIITIPCMSTYFSRPELVPLVTMYQLIVTTFSVYYIIRNLFFKIKNLADFNMSSKDL